jgi:hypothetical protein
VRLAPATTEQQVLVSGGATRRRSTAALLEAQVAACTHRSARTHKHTRTHRRPCLPVAARGQRPFRARPARCAPWAGIGSPQSRCHHTPPGGGGARCPARSATRPGLAACDCTRRPATAGGAGVHASVGGALRGCGCCGCCGCGCGCRQPRQQHACNGRRIVGALGCGQTRLGGWQRWRLQGVRCLM